MNNEDSQYIKCGEVFRANKNDFTFLCYYCNELFYEFIEFRTHISIHLDLTKSEEIVIDIDENHSKFENISVSDNNSIYNEDEENNINKSVLEDYNDELDNNTKIRSKQTNAETESIEDKILNQNITNTDNHEIQKTEELYCSHCKIVVKNESHDLKKCSDIQEKIKQCNGDFLQLLKQGILCCNKCQRYFKNYKLLYEHHLNEKHCTNEHLCKICKFYSFMTLKINSCKQKNDSKKFGNNYDNDSDEGNINKLNEIDIGEDYKRRIRQFRFNCSLCERVFRTNYQKQNHMKIHTNDRPYKCDICSAAFTLQSYLKTHIINKHTEDRPFSCKYEGCNAKFKLPGFLKQHEKTHLPSNFQCEMCGHYYKSKVYLLKHQQSAHTDAKTWPHQCEVCDKRFSQSFRLIEHKRIHTGEKPFPCNICLKYFRKKSNLREHKKLHSEEKKYVCRLCGKGFKQAAGYWGHMKRHPVIS